MENGKLLNKKKFISYKNMKKTFYLTSSLILAALIILASCKDTSRKKKKEPMEKTSYSFISEVKHPGWSKNATLYEINVRQYTEEGTLKAVQEHLPRLKELGVDILWLMPVYPVGEKNKKGLLGSVYAVKDFKAINPNYGTMDDFMELLNKAHEMGFHVLMDWGSESYSMGQSPDRRTPRMVCNR